MQCNFYVYTQTAYRKTSRRTHDCSQIAVLASPRGPVCRKELPGSQGQQNMFQDGPKKQRQNDDQRLRSLLHSPVPSDLTSPLVSRSAVGPAKLYTQHR